MSAQHLDDVDNKPDEDSEYSSSASDYENELVDEYMDDDEGEQPDMVISAEPDDNGVLTQMNNIHYEQPRASKTTVPNEVDDVAGSQFIFSQICSPDEGNVHSNTDTEAVHDHSNLRTETDNVQSNVRTEAVNDESNNAVSASDSEEDTEYIAHSEDSGENSEVVELRRHARKFKKRMRDTKNAHLKKSTKKTDTTKETRATAYAPATAPGRATTPAPATAPGRDAPPARATAPTRATTPAPATAPGRAAPQARATAPARSTPPATAPARSTPPATAPARASAFKPPRARAGQTSAQPRPSTGYKRKRAPASSIPSYKYFTASGNV
ncbi:RING-type E3 ubiquitin transferase [Hordeum vulgare]|nr:RING-type E3 ubiquitin transferase [Hordeum vulgare]